MIILRPFPPLQGIGTDESILTEILCCRTAEEIEGIAWWYEDRKLKS